MEEPNPDRLSDLADQTTRAIGDMEVSNPEYIDTVSFAEVLTDAVDAPEDGVLGEVKAYIDDHCGDDRFSE